MRNFQGSKLARFRRAGIAGLIIVIMASAARVSLAAEGNPEDPKSVFDGAKLTRTGFVLILSDERAVHEQLAKSIQVRSIVTSEMHARTLLKKDFDSAFRDYNQLERQITDLEAQLEQVKGDTKRWNQLVEPHNQMVAQLKIREAKVTELSEKLKKAHDSRDAWRDSVVTALQQGQQTTAKYAALAKDERIKSAIDRYNASAAQKVVLGPSGQFKEDVEAIRKIVSDMAADGVPAEIGNGTPVVQVTINGVSVPMVWDSGCSDVSLSGETAEKLGIHPPVDAPTVKAQIADGSTVEAKVVIVPSITVGVFIATNVQCSVLPKDPRKAPDLLGGTFQEHFVCRVDQSAGVIHLTPKDPSASIAGLVDAPAPVQGPTVSANAGSSAAPEATGPFATWKLNLAGGLLVLPQESAVRTATLKVRGLHTSLESEMNARAGVNRAIDALMPEYERLSSRLVDLEKQIADLKKQADDLQKQTGEQKDDPTANNRLVTSYDETLRGVNQQSAKIEELRKRLTKVQDSQSDFVNALGAAVKLADPARKQYDDLVKDAKLAAAITAYNGKNAEPVKIGPSRQFVSDSEFLSQCVEQFMAEGIPARVENGTPEVEVTINDKKIEMTWDSGASFVCLSSETADELGIHPTEKDPTIETTIADGSKLRSKLVTLPSVRVGPFTVKNVKCLVMPKGTHHSPDLLGGTFQQHFLCRIDHQAGVIHLTPSDSSVSVSKTGHN